MGRVYDKIDDRWARWIGEQHMFFVATAPRTGGHVNCSPKGLDSFRIVGERDVAYVDLVGSGAETIAHVRENGRITLMFCAFAGPPLILRIHGTGEVIEPGDPDWDDLAVEFPEHPLARAIVRVKAERISDSCGFGVPLMEFSGNRPQMEAWASRKQADGIRQYQLENNLESVDGLPALRGKTLRRPE